jgi:CHAT domain-containing protein/tetratricopeptide (TPR) repeat protein
MRTTWLLAGALALAGPFPALAQGVDIDARLKLPEAAKRDDTSRLFWLRNAGRVAFAKDDFEGSRLAWEAALPLAEKLHGPDARETEAVLFELGLSWYNLGQYSRALPIYQRDYQLRRTLFGPDSKEALIVLANIASMYLQLGRIEDALPVQEEIYAAGVRARGESDHDVLIDRNNLAVSYRLLGRYEEAEANLREIVRLRKAGGDESEESPKAVGNLLQVLYQRGKAGESEKVVADAGFAQMVRTPETGQFYVPGRHFLAWQLARAYFITGRTTDAIAVLEPTVVRSRERLGAGHPDTIGYARALAEYKVEAAFAFQQSDPRAFAARTREALADARSAADGLRERTGALGFTPNDETATAGDADLRSSVFSMLAVIDGVALMTAADQKEQGALQNEAIQAIQQAMDGTASRAVAETAARNAAAGKGLAPLVEARQDLADQWAVNQDSLAKAIARRDAAGEAERLRLVAEASVLEEQLAAADMRLREAFPAYFDLIRPAPLTSVEAANLVKADEAVLLILPTPQNTQIMMITSQGIGWTVSTMNEYDIARLTRRLLWDVGGNVDVTAAEEAAWQDEGAGAYPFARGTAYQLYQELVEPWADLIADKRHLFVIAGGPLSSLPFGMLVAAPPQGEDGDPEALRQTEWLADKVALIQLPSLQSLAFLRKYGGDAAPAGPQGAEFLGFGDPVLDGVAVPRGGRGKDGSRRRTGASVSRGSDGQLTLATLRRMVRLPGTAEELEAMRKVMAAPMGQIFTGARATEANFRHADLADARVIALATHGLMAGELAGNAEPGLVFTPPAQPSGEDDGFLSASEIASLRFSADWVILSACNTAAGDGSSGAPGLSGLARAFFYAGAESLLASHWPVRDDVASRLTVRSIEIRRDNPDLSRAEALQKAMREIRMNKAHDSDSDTWAHPSAWAPFTLVGDGTK